MHDAQVKRHHFNDYDSRPIGKEDSVRRASSAVDGERMTCKVKTQYTVGIFKDSGVAEGSKEPRWCAF